MRRYPPLWHSRRQYHTSHHTGPLSPLATALPTYEDRLTWSLQHLLLYYCSCIWIGNLRLIADKGARGHHTATCTTHVCIICTICIIFIICIICTVCTVCVCNPVVLRGLERAPYWTCSSIPPLLLYVTHVTPTTLSYTQLTEWNEIRRFVFNDPVVMSR